jgi:hypothetical protein
MNLFYYSPILFIFFYVLYNIRLDVGFNKPEVFITIASFLFAIFTGFFISRQNQRHVEIRQEIAENDGEFSAVYRSFSHISARAQKEAGKIIKKHFEKILKMNDWAYHIKNKSTTLIDLNELLGKYSGNKKLASRKHITTELIMNTLIRLQTVRKRLIAHHQERMTSMQWGLIAVLTLILLSSLSFLENTSFIVPIYKAFFAVIILVVVNYIYRLNNLTLFKDTFGKQSSRDVVEIIEGKK